MMRVTEDIFRGYFAPETDQSELAQVVGISTRSGAMTSFST
jgi:hypothetical protein